MEKKRFWTYENKLMVILALTFGFVFFDRLAVSYLSPFIIEDLKLSNTQFGLLASGLAFTWAISGYLLGLFSANGRQKKTLIIMVIIFSICSLFSGLATSFIMLLIFRMIMGFAEGPVNPIAQSMMAIESTESRRGFNMGFINASFTNLLGSILAPVILVTIANMYSWRTSLFATAIPSLFMALLLWKFIKEPNKINININSLPQSSERENVRFIDILKYRNIWLSILIGCFSLTWYIVYLTFAPSYLVQVKHYSPGDMSIIMSVIGIATLIWGLAAPALSDRIGRKPIVIGVSLLAALSPLTILFFDGPMIALALILILVHAANGGQAIFMSIIPSESIPAKYIAPAAGLIIGAGEIVGGVFGPMVGGVVADAFGLAAPLWICTFAALIAGIISMFLIETAPIKTKKKLETLETIKETF